MAGTERVAGGQYRRALLTLAAVLVVGGASLTSPSVLSSHSSPPGNAMPSVPVVTPVPGATPTPSSTPTPTVAGTSDVDPTSAPPSVPTATPVPSEPTATMTNLHKITTKRVTVAFTTVTRKDPDLAKGKTKVLRAGVKGINELTYTDGKLTSTKVIKKPVSKLVAVGTKTVKPWISEKQCSFDHQRRVPIVHVTVNDPDKVGYHLWIVWGDNKRDYTATGTKSFDYQAEWYRLRWTNCQVWLS